MISFYRNIWSKKITWKDRVLFGTMLLLITGYYFYSLFFKKDELLSVHLTELFCLPALILVIVLVKPLGNFILKLWFCISGSFGQLMFFIIQFVVFYVALSPVYILLNLVKKKNRSEISNWSVNPPKNTNYKNPG